MQVRRAARQGRRRSQQERIPLHPESRDGRAGPSDQRDAGADRNLARGRAAVADAADSAHGSGQADGARCLRSSRWRFRRSVSRSSRPVPIFTPPAPNFIIAPGTGGGANYGPLSYSPRTGLLYVNAIDDPLNSGRPPKGYFSAFDPTTGELKWQQIFDGYGQAGSVVTAGGLVFVGSGSNVAGYFFAFDAKTGRAALEVQHRRGRVRLAIGVHGERRAVRDRGLRRRRARPPRRRSDSELCVAAVRREHWL